MNSKIAYYYDGILLKEKLGIENVSDTFYISLVNI